MSTSNDIFRGIGVEIDLATSEDFLKIRETLTRIGIEHIEGDDRQLSQVCYILHKRGRYVIAHARELEWFDGCGPGADDKDVAIRNRVALLLESWSQGDDRGLGVGIVDDGGLAPVAPLSAIRVLAYREKAEWRLVSPYMIGAPKRPELTSGASRGRYYI